MNTKTQFELVENQDRDLQNLNQPLQKITEHMLMELDNMYTFKEWVCEGNMKWSYVPHTDERAIKLHLSVHTWDNNKVRTEDLCDLHFICYNTVGSDVKVTLDPTFLPKSSVYHKFVNEIINTNSDIDEFTGICSELMMESLRIYRKYQVRIEQLIPGDSFKIGNETFTVQSIHRIDTNLGINNPYQITYRMDGDTWFLMQSGNKIVTII